ncbi:hypothetical protein HHL22_16725 [Hymenobacter sp. RP-2-7]|uniref:Uncharacterized protein n=1 Tax=Hymenobacter polaris TaxID=2682546 RepID=A0A7Y0FND7_9BACT|nr:hypothetical protein [Hymenobacter polaris]NML66852.1 hypothetical protein [Hymenobacter polaris]
MNLQPKALLLAAGLALAGAAAPSAAHAQLAVNVQLGHPTWGPAVPAGVQYYYIPEIGGYYDLAAQRYLVQRNGRWVPVAAVPGYDPHSFHPVVLRDYRGREPWVQYRTHYARYPRPVVVQQPVVARPVVVRQPVVVQRPTRPVVVQHVNRRGRVVERVRY